MVFWYDMANRYWGACGGGAGKFSVWAGGTAAGLSADLSTGRSSGLAAGSSSDRLGEDATV